MIEIKCNICGKRIPSVGDISEIITFSFWTDVHKDDLCNKCAKKVRKNYYSFKRELKQQIEEMK